MTARSMICGIGLVFACGPMSFGGLLTNAGFEAYGQAAGTEKTHNDASINPAGGWFTTESDHQIEVWGSGFLGVQAAEGNNFVELNANAVSDIYQFTSGIAAGDRVRYSFAHRGRSGVDTMRFEVYDQTTGAFLIQRTVADGNSAWGHYNGFFVAGAGVKSTDSIKITFVSVSSVGGSTYGNLLDDVGFSLDQRVNPASATPEPSTLASGTLAVALAAFGYRRRKNA